MRNYPVFFIVIFAVVLVGSVALPSTATASPPPDLLGQYSISITPQTDGTLVMHYDLRHYCTYSDWPKDQPYLQIGIPNKNAAVTDWSPKEGPLSFKSATLVKSGGSFVQMNFNSVLPKNGECFDLSFSIIQSKMAYADPENGNITFEFFPAGWEFPIEVEDLTISWELPGGLKLLSVTPASMAAEGNVMFWHWQKPSMNASHMFASAKISFVYDKAGFTIVDTAKADQPGGAESVDLQCCWTIFWIVVIILVIWFFIAVINESYTSGDGLGPSTVTVIGHTAEVVDDILSSSGGGSGGSSGRSSGCACAGCACACACAGGGKIGCSRKAIGISCLLKVLGNQRRKAERSWLVSAMDFLKKILKIGKERYET